jgi:hypothetical protein
LGGSAAASVGGGRRMLRINCSVRTIFAGCKTGLVSVELLELLGSLCAPLAALPGGRAEREGRGGCSSSSGFPSLSLCARAEREIGRRWPGEVGVPVVQTGAGRAEGCWVVWSRGEREFWGRGEQRSVDLTLNERESRLG